MYIPEIFEVTEQKEIFSFLESNSFGQLISTVEGRLFSTHLPWLVSHDKSRLIGHLAIQNPQHSSLEGQEVLVTFEGPHDYISPTWYSSPGVPTWNYQAVHVYGQVSIIRDSGRVRQVVENLAHQFEGSSDEPWEPRYSGSLLEAIVAFEIAITEVQCKFKLGQNRSLTDRQQVGAQLRKRGSEKLAQAMETSC